MKQIIITLLLCIFSVNVFSQHNHNDLIAIMNEYANTSYVAKTHYERISNTDTEKTYILYNSTDTIKVVAKINKKGYTQTIVYKNKVIDNNLRIFDGMLSTRLIEEVDKVRYYLWLHSEYNPNYHRINAAKDTDFIIADKKFNHILKFIR